MRHRQSYKPIKQDTASRIKVFEDGIESDRTSLVPESSPVDGSWWLGVFGLRSLTMDKGDDPYEILGVSPEATEAEIKKAYRKKALKYHPDRQPTQEANAIFARISNAYEILSDPEQRQNYDLQQKYGGNRGFDPNGPQYRSTAPSSSGANPSPQTTASTRTTFRSVPTTTRTTTFRSSSVPDGFHDPFEVFRRAFGDHAFDDDFFEKSTTTCTSSPGSDFFEKRTSPCTSSPRSVATSSMSSSTRHVHHPDGRIETIKETVVTRMDGSMERRKESSFSMPTKTTSVPCTMATTRVQQPRRVVSTRTWSNSS